MISPSLLFPTSVRLIKLCGIQSPMIILKVMKHKKSFHHNSAHRYLISSECIQGDNLDES